MRRLLLASVAVAMAAASALLISLFAFSESSLASGAPSQGTYTQGATAGPNEPSLVDDTPPSTAERDDSTVTAASHRFSGRDLVKVGKWHLGTPYRASPPGPCKAYHWEDCSCFTRVVFAHFLKFLPDNPVKQYKKYGRKVPKSKLKRGDLVAFKEAGRHKPITHVAIYAGHGKILHASNYFGKVVESKMKYMRGYFGAKRIR